MITSIKERKNTFLSTSVFIDYENIFKRLQSYGKTPTQIDFFNVINKRLEEQYALNIVDNIAYCNFERTEMFDSNHQTELQSIGLQTRHTSNNGKNSADLEMTVDALKTLYKNPKIEVFILISCDRDLIPLIKAIKEENKISFVLSTKNGFDKIVTKYADFHEYIEDIFNLSKEIQVLVGQELTGDKILDSANAINIEELQQEVIDNAKNVSGLLYKSDKWRKHDINPVGLIGYSQLLTNKLSKLRDDVVEYFKCAHALKYVEIYIGEDKQLYLREGSNSKEITSNELTQ
ncbi:hypothetical protein Desaci_1467 [Desulfosporosinus acidiphilus SJ4]|uniref:NYN domain-containing protein n=1 Tax=Desulfosporosinus acidiphilus (strain DSM 22704 / JCM 16185 / SJ4) TaxID=646529 RepID=I4D3V9_DESAJ|nr:NYN domain-containing protein [Desulfosporosinus acidiphilus]AFM40483.1 hypothetical protein Desaci_1467 [Desulfosporosinus acidiphilus SJ4]